MWEKGLKVYVKPLNDLVETNTTEAIQMYEVPSYTNLRCPHRHQQKYHWNHRYRKMI